MPIKTILVHLTHDDRAHVCLETALSLARWNKAHIVALYITTPLGVGMTVPGRGASAVFVEEAREAARRHAAEVRLGFDAACEAAEITHDWVLADGEHVEELRRHAHVADLAIVRQSEAKFLEDHIRPHLPDTLVHLVGCPVMMLPVHGDRTDPPSHALVAWKPVVSCVRAVRGSIQVLQQTGRVTVMTIADTADHVPGEEVVAFLGRHGIDATALNVHGSDNGAGKLILEYQEKQEADLIVMGSQSRSAVTEFIFGGATNQVFHHATVPILTSH